MRLLVGLQVVNLHVNAELFGVPEFGIEPRHDFGGAEHELAGADLLRRHVLELAAVGHDQRAGFELVVFKARNLQTRVLRRRRFRSYVLDYDVQPIQSWTQRNCLLINRLQLQRLLVQAFRESPG